MEQQKDTRAAIREKEVLRLQEAQVHVALLLTVQDSLDRVEPIQDHGIPGRPLVTEPAAAEGRLVVIPGDFDWDDVGDFAAIGKLHSGGRKNNLAILGDDPRVLADASTGVVVSNSGRLISLVGVKDIVVVDTDDALLVTTTQNAQRVKSVVDALKLSGRGEVL